MVKRKSYLAIAPIRKLMGQSGAKIVSGDAVIYMKEYLEALTKAIAERALKITKHGGRKKIQKGDIELALKK